MIGKQLLHYVVLKKLGEGGMGAVYLAKDLRLDRQVALKFLSNEISKNKAALERFEQEAKHAAALVHPNIAQVYAIEEDKGHMFIVFQYIEGQELDEYVINNALDDNQKLGFAHHLADGLLAAHESGIIHRDIKAGNIMISSKGELKILDFGVAGLLDADHSKSSEEQIGTSNYMAPELLVGNPATIKSEIWAYGVVLYQLFSGKLPFDGHYQQAISYAIMHQEPVPIKELVPDIPEVANSIIATCLDKEPEARFDSLTEIIHEIESYKTTSTGLKSTTVSVLSKTQKLIGASLFVVLLIALVISNLDLFNSTTETKRLAIIPFKNVGENIENTVFLDGILETMTSKLSQIDNYEDKLWVIPSSEILSNEINSISEARRIFGINLAVTGSLQNIDGNKRLTINLIDAENLRQLRSQVIDISSDNMIGLQAESVIRLIQMLDIDRNERIIRTLNEGGTDNAEASAFYLSGKGYLYRYTQGNYLENSIGLFKRAINKDPEFVLAFATISEAYWRKYEQTKVVNYVDSAQFYLDKAMILNSDLLEVQQVQALLSLGSGNYDNAVETYGNLIALDAKNDAAYSGLAEAYDNLGEIEKAEEAYLSAIEIKPDYWLGHKNLGNFYMKNGDYEKAIIPLQQVVALTPDNNDGFSNLGVLYYYLSDWEKSITAFTQSLEIKPTESAASNLGTVYYIQGNYEEAAKYYEIAVDVNPNNYAVWGNLASLQGILGNDYQEIKLYRKAIEVAEKQLAVNPNDITLNTQLAAYYSDIGDIENANFYVEKTRLLAPNVPEVSFRLASVYEKIGQRTEAIDLMKTAIEQEYPIENILNQPELKALVEDVEFQRYLNSINNN